MPTYDNNPIAEYHSFDEGLRGLREHTLNALTGAIAWAILMKTGLRQYKLYLRNNQPCYGEMRKYQSTHPTECTQPEDKKPSDLHYPFPNGVPVALGVSYGILSNPLMNRVAELVFHPRLSPWRRGLSAPELLYKNGMFYGLLLADTKLDPTVLVHALKVIRNLTWTVNLKVWQEMRIDPYAALVVSSMMGSYNPTAPYYAYYSHGMYTMQLDVKRFKDRNPVDLTGGTLKDRFDYNRKKLTYIFDSPDGISVSHKIVGITGQGKIIPIGKMEEAVNEVFK